MENQFRNILINSTLAFTSAFFITTFLHESGHYIAYLFFGADPILYHNYVRVINSALDDFPRVFSVLAGPAVSLVQGFIFAWVLTRKPNGNSAQFLFFLWLSLLGYVNFFGYLIMTPLFATGDTGKAAEILKISMTYRAVLAAGGLILLVLIILKVGRMFIRFIPNANNTMIKTKYVYHVMFYPIIIGSIIKTVFSFPAVVFLSVVYPATSSFMIMISFGVIVNAATPHLDKPDVAGKINIPFVLMTIAVILLNRLLTSGVG